MATKNKIEKFWKLRCDLPIECQEIIETIQAQFRVDGVKMTIPETLSKFIKEATFKIKK